MTEHLPGQAPSDRDPAAFGATLDHADDPVPSQDPFGPVDESIDEFADEEPASSDDPARRAQVERYVSWGIVALCMGFVFWSLHPQLLLSDTTPTGGDMGAHVWGPAFLSDHLLPEFRVTGWTQDWYAGFPAYVFYMVVPSLAIVWLSAGLSWWLTPLLLLVIAALVAVVRPRIHAWWGRALLWVAVGFLVGLALPLPYNVAFKLVTVSGLVTLPLAAYALARAARAPFPAAPLAALATLPFIYDHSFRILGGNGASTMAGEFAFSISLTLALLYLAVLFKGIRTGADRALGAVLLALTILCHLIPAIFAGVATLVLAFVRREDRVPWWDRSTTGRLVVTVLIGVTLLTIAPSVQLPFGIVLSSPLMQWWFPALGTLVAIVVLTGFEPRLVRWWLTGAGRVVGALILLGGAVLLLTRSGWMTVTVVGVALLVAFFSGWDDRLVRWLLVVAPAGIALTGFWSAPFLLSSTYMNDMGWEKYTRYRDYLLSDVSTEHGGMPYRNIVFALAGLGVLLALVHRVRFGWFLALTAVTFAWTFRYFPQYRLWNARLLPFYYLALYLLAGLGVALAARSLAFAVADLRRRADESLTVGVLSAAAATLAVAVVLLASFGSLPGGRYVAHPDDTSRNRYRWAGIDFETGVVPGWARYNYEGLEGKPAWPEFSGVIEMMERVGDEHGCGRAMWEYEPQLDRFGTPMALMLLPYFTDTCIGSMEGLYFEASSTTPFHFLNQSALSPQPSRAQRDLPYTAFDIDLGVSQLQMLGVRYYMASSDEAIAAAREHPDLTEVASESFAAVGTTEDVASNEWVVFQVADSDLVVGLERTPVVLEDADDHIDGWVYAPERAQAAEGQPRPRKDAGPAVRWFQDPDSWDTHLATGGPEDWPRGAESEASSISTVLPPVVVSDVETTSDSVSFSVDRVGVPVLVRTSYFPNWGVDGAEGPWRVSPNFMVVVPNAEQVTLSYGHRAPDLLGWLLTAIGLLGLAGLVALDARARRSAGERGDLVADRDAPDHDAPDPEASDPEASDDEGSRPDVAVDPLPADP